MFNIRKLKFYKLKVKSKISDKFYKILSRVEFTYNHRRALHPSEVTSEDDEMWLSKEIVPEEKSSEECAKRALR